MKTSFYSAKLVILLIVLSGAGFSAFSQTTTFSYTGSVQTWTVPAGVTSLNIDMQGAIGGANSAWPSGAYADMGGNGGRVQCTLTVTPGQVLNIYVGGQGVQGTATTGGAAGYNDDGAVGTVVIGVSNPGGGGGGGASDIRIGGTTLTDRVVVAGGGGGGGGYAAGEINQVRGGDGGGLTGQTAYNNGVSAPGLGSGGGTQTSGGATYGGPPTQDGTLGYGGAGAGAGADGEPPNGGGGGGYYGGAGGLTNMGGGGGSSYTDPVLATAVTHTQGYNTTGDGVVIITIPEAAPTFVNGSPQMPAVCENGSMDLSSVLSVNDINTGDVETWSIADSSLHGGLSGFNTTATATGGTVSPAGLAYTPATGYAGADTFTIMVNDGNGGTATTTIYVTVNPLPGPITGFDSICAGATTVLTDDSTGGSWSSNNSSVATVGTIGNVQGILAGTTVITYTLPTTCFVTLVETVNPNPSVNSMDIPEVCNNSENALITFTGPVPGTVYNWTDTSHIGMPNSGSDSIGSFIASNPADTAIISTIIVTPTAHGCIGQAKDFTITVNPTPSVDTVMSQVVCNGAPTTRVDFTGPVSGTSYTWLNSDTSIGLTAMGMDSIVSFAAMDTAYTDTGSLVPITGVITVTPVANSCQGPVQTFSITVNPTPNVNPVISNPTYCNGSPTAAIVFTGAVSGSTFTWTNSDTSIDLAALGSGNISSFTATDDSTFPITGSIVVTAAAPSGCTGTSTSFEIVVNPTPKLTSTLTPIAKCDSIPFAYMPTSATSGTSYTWFRDTVSGISNGMASDTGAIYDTLVNTTTHPVTVTYQYALAANTCMDTQLVMLVVNPNPKLSTTLTPHAVCDSDQFIYGPNSATAGTTYTWSRDSIPGIRNSAGNGADTINERLVNTTNTSLTVIYVDTLLANGCTNTQSISVVVRPKPMLSSPLTIAARCDSLPFFYVPVTSTIPADSVTFTWSRAAIGGNPAASGGDTISEWLIDTSVNPVSVIYVDTIKAFSCSNTEDITVTVNPKPVLNSPLTASQCDSMLFNYTPTSATTGATFAWDRPYLMGIAIDSAHGTGNPDEPLYNTTYSNIDVNYNYTITANGCSNTQTVTVEVHPTPTLVNPLSASVCSGSYFNDTLVGFVFGTSYAWSRPAVPGISPTTHSGIGDISEILTDSALMPIQTMYNVILTANGCSHTQEITVTVNPTPPSLDITTHPPSSLCSNTQYQNFGTGAPPPAGQAYTWTATNASVMATGNTGQYSLISFPTAGTAVVTVKSDITGIGCITNNSYTVNVGGGVSTTPKVIYYNGQFMCLENSDTYQWGYDDVHTLDSTLVPGEVNQVYFISGADLADRYYWVMTTHDGCMQKSYYNVPTGIVNVNTEVTSIKVYPNPAASIVNVDINTAEAGNYEVKVVNMLGQELQNAVATDHKAQLNVAGLPAGCYLVDCYRDGVKIAAARFIKN